MAQEVQKTQMYLVGTAQVTAHNVEKYQTQVLHHLNGEVNLGLQRNHQETLKQKREAAAWFGTLKDEVKFCSRRPRKVTKNGICNWRK